MLSPAQGEVLSLSLWVATTAVLASLLPALAVAWFLARSRWRGKMLVDALVHLPLVLPPVVTGYLLLVGLGRNSLVGSWLAETFGLVFAFQWTGAALAGAIMGFPLLVRPIRLSLEAIDTRVEAAAATLGASPVWVVLTVTVPLALPGVIAGMVLAFARALGEFGATITFASNIPGETRTLPIAIYTFIQVPGGENEALQLILISIAVSLSALIVSELIARRVKRLQAPL
ncbi:molybdate ABC transporter permease subunit [Salinisphaera sp.]|uniref:molybdate ABC transporter permease subunit n=1 Tax=Salinisphaera sp. TaxID=1914330 RepID=UPI000C41E54E|nr:molybdate ABC transporter permease subunit [Salinisphaera sp.]MAS09082.1 molybdate ABC transporter permease subunit [Salinisphaera sp.]|tara:strand:- start:1094 stop:1783 length:690 start_codon:yes stop_codon:yes gene_type:complete